MPTLITHVGAGLQSAQPTRYTDSASEFRSWGGSDSYAVSFVAEATAVAPLGGRSLHLVCVGLLHSDLL